MASTADHRNQSCSTSSPSARISVSGLIGVIATSSKSASPGSKPSVCALNANLSSSAANGSASASGSDPRPRGRGRRQCDWPALARAVRQHPLQEHGFTIAGARLFLELPNPHPELLPHLRCRGPFQQFATTFSFLSKLGIAWHSVLSGVFCRISFLSQEH